MTPNRQVCCEQLGHWQAKKEKKELMSESAGTAQGLLAKNESETLALMEGKSMETRVYKTRTWQGDRSVTRAHLSAFIADQDLVKDHSSIDKVDSNWDKRMLTSSLHMWPHTNAYVFTFTHINRYIHITHTHLTLVNRTVHQLESTMPAPQEAFWQKPSRKLLKST